VTHGAPTVGLSDAGPLRILDVLFPMQQGQKDLWERDLQTGKGQAGFHWHKPRSMPYLQTKKVPENN
jgi:hypothetical protein